MPQDAVPMLADGERRTKKQLRNSINSLILLVNSEGFGPPTPGFEVSNPLYTSVDDIVPRFVPRPNLGTKKELRNNRNPLILLVGMRGFEPPAP